MERYEKYKDSGIEWIGEIPEHWEVKKIKHLTKLQGGYAFKSDLFSPEGTPVIRIGDISDNINFEECKKIDDDTILKEFWLNQFDTLIALSGATTGKTCFVNDIPPKAYINQRVARILFSNKLLYYIINSAFFQEQISLTASGSAQENISNSQIENIEIPITKNPKEQTTIANYLDRKTTEIDSIISNKQKLITLYEEEKQAIINQAVTKGLDTNVKLKDSGVEWLGEIPEHWDVKQFRHCITVLTDFTANGSFASLAENVTYYDSGYSRLIRLTDLRVDFENDGVYVDERAHNFLKKSELFGGEILIANVGAYAGLAILMPKPNGVCTLGPNMFLIRTNQNSNYITILLNSEFYKNQLRNIALSSAQPKLNKDDIKALVISVPEIGEQEQILDYIEKECSKFNLLISKYTKQIDLLQEYRTTLISEVVTGKVKII